MRTKCIFCEFSFTPSVAGREYSLFGDLTSQVAIVQESGSSHLINGLSIHRHNVDTHLKAC